MGIRESLLNTITSVGSSDFVRIVTSAGASSKATLANVFKSFESGLGAKSSLTTSDYVRVVGSDNNAYKQSVSAMKTAMGIDALEANTVSTVFGSPDTSKYTINNVKLVRQGNLYILMGEVRCISPATSEEVNIVSSGMPAVYTGQAFVPAWGVNNAQKDALGVHFAPTGVLLSYGTAGGYYELAIPMLI